MLKSEENLKKSYDTAYCITAVRITDELGIPIDEPVSGDLTIFLNSKTSGCMYYCPDFNSPSDGQQTDWCVEAVDNFLQHLKKVDVLQSIGSLRELVIGILFDDFSDFEYETGLHVKILTANEYDYSNQVNTEGFRVYARKGLIVELADNSLRVGDLEISNASELFDFIQKIPEIFYFANG